MPKAMVNGINLHYWRLGQGPDIAMLHGLGGNLAVWHLQMVPELQHEYRVTTYDLRGHGYSDAPRDGYTTQDLVEDLRGLLDTLEIERAHLVGHSWGGDIALHFALLHPERVMKLVVIEAGLIAALAHLYKREDWKGWAYWEKMLDQVAGIRVPPEKRNDLDYLLTQIMKIPIVYGPAKGQPRDEDLVLRVLNILKPAWHGYGSEGDLTVDNLSKISHQTLLIYETNSLSIWSYEVLRDHLPNSTSVLLPDGKLKHFTTLERPTLVLEHIRAFLQPDRVQASSVLTEQQQ